jgi:hypothetical protein
VHFPPLQQEADLRGGACGFRVSLALVLALICSFFVLIVSLNSFDSQISFFANELMNQMERRRVFFEPAVTRQFMELAVVPPGVASNLETDLGIFTASSAVLIEREKDTLFLAGFLARLLVIHFYFQPVLSSSVICAETGLVITYTPGDLHVHVTEPVETSEGEVIFQQQPYSFTLAFSLQKTPNSTPQLVADWRNDEDLGLMLQSYRSISRYGPDTKYGRAKKTNSWNNRTLGTPFVPIMLRLRIDNAPMMLVRAEYPTTFLASAWAQDTGGESNQLLFDADCTIITSNVKDWSNVCTCSSIPEVGAIIQKYLEDLLEDEGDAESEATINITGRTDRIYFSITRLDVGVDVVNGHWYLFESSEIPRGTWSTETSGWRVGILVASILFACLLYYFFSTAIFSPLVQLASALEATAKKHRAPVSTDESEDSTGDRGNASNCGFACPDFWGVRAAHTRIVTHVDEVLSFVPKKVLLQFRHKRANSLVQASPGVDSDSGESWSLEGSHSAPAGNPGTPIELLQRARGKMAADSDEIGLIRHCRMSALHFEMFDL